jgi:hypothetical protein
LGKEADNAWSYQTFEMAELPKEELEENSAFLLIDIKF